jgi:hypothetical protein
VEKGVDIPPALLVKPPEKKNDRRTGTILLTLGIGVCGFLALVDRSGSGAWGLGLVPTFLGLGYLMASMFEKKPTE